GDRIVAKVGVEREEAAMHVGLAAIDLAANECETGQPIVLALSAPQLRGAANLILRPVNRDRAFGANKGQPGNRHVWPDSIWLRLQQRSHAVETERDNADSFGVPT